MKHKMELQPRYYDYIKDGTKRIELRLLDNKRKQIEIGDTIEFSRGDGNTFDAKVVGLLKYDSFPSLFNDFDINMLADANMTKDELLAILGEFYTPEKQKSLGVVGIRIELIE